MDAVLTLALIALVALVALVALIAVVAAWHADRRRTHERIEQLLQTRDKDVLQARRESVERSRSSLKGQIAEQLAPLLPGFLYLPADARFLGDPIDYVVFNGYSNLRDEGPGSEPLEVVLLEVKQGSSALSPFQRSIARSVEEGRVRFEVCRIEDNGSVACETWRPRRA